MEKEKKQSVKSESGVAAEGVKEQEPAAGTNGESPVNGGGGDVCLIEREEIRGMCASRKVNKGSG